MSSAPLTPRLSSPVTIDEARVLVNDYLFDYFAEKISSANVLHPSYARLWEYTYALFSAGGKRIRPYITLLSYQAAGGLRPLSDIVPAACAQEILHLALLVHDDIIDRDTVRYGVANVTGQYRALYAGALRPEDVEHYADAASLLAGDLLLSGAYELTSRLTLPAKDIVAASQTLSNAVFTVASGELLDIESAFVRDPASAKYIASHKTASYSCIGPLVMGAQFANASKAYIELLTTFGLNLGIAFQLQDDLSTIFGQTAIASKIAPGDIREGKRTYLVEQFYRLATQKQKNDFTKIFGQETATYKDTARIRTLLQETGATKACEKSIQEHAVRAKDLLKQLQLEPHFFASFENLISICTQQAD